MIGGGCRGLDLARDLRAEGHAVRAVTRREDRRGAIEAAGAECCIADPDVVGTLRYALDNVTVLLWLLGAARGGAVALTALHGPRLRMMLEKTTDTTVRGVVYEVSGPVDPAILRGGVEEMERARRTNEIPYALLDSDRSDGDAWVRAARAAIDAVLAVRRGAPDAARAAG
jgi:uncharacterized protein YbjT (DUF2867 family)